MDTREKIIDAAKNEDPLKRQMSIAAIISTELEKKGTHIVLVGGSAVEFYTVANYLTRDIDFIAARPDNIKQVMTELGFKNDGGTWYLPEHPNIVVEFPKGPLDGSWERVQNVSGPDGTSVNVISIEDILIDRASGVKYWNDSDEWVKYMMVGNYDRIDWDYLNTRSRELQCEEIIEKSREWARNQREHIINELSNSQENRIKAILNVEDKPVKLGNKKDFNPIREYRHQAKTIINESDGWPGVSADIKIVQNMLLKGYDKFKIKDAMIKASPETGVSVEKTSQYTQSIMKQALTPEIQKRVRELSRGLER